MLWEITAVDSENETKPATLSKNSAVLLMIKQMLDAFTIVL
jgi:hypothetical protein